MSRSKFGERAERDQTRSISRHQKVSGGHTGGATPDPIPNSEVKTSRADGTAGETLWESRSPPGLFAGMKGPGATRSGPFSFVPVSPPPRVDEGWASVADNPS